MLGRAAGAVRLNSAGDQAHAIAAMAAQSSRQLLIMTPDLAPTRYEQPVLLDAVRRLALHQRRQQPVRILVGDAEPCVRRGHRLIDLARQFTSAIGIRVLPGELVAHCDHYLLADDTGYFRQPVNARTNARASAIADFDDRRQVRLLRHDFEQCWARSSEAPVCGGYTFDDESAPLAPHNLNTNWVARPVSSASGSEIQYMLLFGTAAAARAMLSSTPISRR
jgi:hypothetical protein